MYLKTRVSEAFWFDPGSKNPRAWIKPARIPGMMEESSSQDTTTNMQGISWLDSLFKGGVLLPEAGPDAPRAITILITGPPGAGKSILAMELCYRWCINEKWSSLYITSESHQPWMIEKAKPFDWKNATPVFQAEGKSASAVSVVPVEKFFLAEDWIIDIPKKANPTKKVVKELWNLFYSEGGHTADESETLGQMLNQLPESDEDAARILVLDSLNTVYDESRRVALFNHFMNLASSGPRILIVIFDSAPSGKAAEFWEFISDIVVSLDRNYDLGYMVRTLEIVKARYQRHVWGIHQLKIYEPARLAKEGHESQGIQIQDKPSSPIPKRRRNLHLSINTLYPFDL